MLDYEGLRTGAGIFDVLSRAQALERQGKQILHFEIGQPDFPTPECVKDAAKQALDENFTGYVSAQGILELKEAIQNEIDWYDSMFEDKAFLNTGVEPGSLD